QLLDERAVAFDALALQVVEHAATLTDELEQTTARMVVLEVRLEVLGEVGDPLGEEGDLDLGGSGVGIVTTEFSNNFGLTGRLKRSGCPKRTTRATAASMRRSGR